MSLNALAYNLRSRFEQQDGPTLGAFFRPLHRAQLANLRVAVTTLDARQVSLGIEKSFGHDLSREGAVVAAFLDYVRVVDLDSDGQDVKTANFDALAPVYNAANAILRDAPYFAPALRNLTRALSKLAIEASRKRLQTNQYPKAEAAVRLMMTALSYALMKMAPGQAPQQGPSQGDAALTLANELFRIYFFMNNLKLCDTVLNKIGSVEGQLDTRYPRSETVLFRYFRGRVYLYQRNLLKAQQYFAKAFEMCTSKSYHNRRAILIYLVAVALPVGRLPPRRLLAAYDLDRQYGPLVEAVKVGNWPAVRDSLEEHCQWHRRHGTFIMLREKLEVLCWRNLFRNLAGLRGSATAGGEQMRSSLTMAQCVGPARAVFEDDTIDEDDVECMACSLIEQNLLRGYVKTGTAVVFSRQMPLPSVQAGLAARRIERERGDA